MEDIHMDIQEQLWQKCVGFHGHECGGLLIGFRASLYAMELLDLGYSADEEVTCIAENDACGVDAIQVILGCSVGKGNLLFKLRGKQAFNFYDRKTGKSIRLLLRETGPMEKEEKCRYLKEQPAEKLFEIKTPAQEFPEKARIFRSVRCDCCKEMTSKNMIRLQDGKQVCLYCFSPYSRFL